MKSFFSILIAALVVFLIIIFTSTFTVDEGEHGLLFNLGKLEKNRQGEVQVFNPGLHWKLPMIESAENFDTRLQTLDISSSRIVTAEKKDVIVDYYVKWRIQNLPQFFISTGGDSLVAANLLQQQVNDNLRAQFGRRTINEVVTDDRSKIMVALLQQANLSAQTLGIQVIDVRIKRIDLPSGVSIAVFNRMRAERERAATAFRSKGQADAMAIRANADAMASLTIAKAQAQAAGIRAKGLALAAKIYSDAYSKDPAFYSFYRSLGVYQNIFTNQHDFVVLQPSSEFMRYFDSSSSNTPATKNSKS